MKRKNEAETAPKRWIDELEETLEELEQPGSNSAIMQNQNIQVRNKQKQSDI